MAIVSLRQLLDHAAEHDYGVPAFNINNMEQMLAIMAAADKTDSPVVMQASRGARKYANDIVLAHLIKAAAELYPHIPICMHQDHGNNAETCMSAMTNGFSSVMMDGSLEEDGHGFEGKLDKDMLVTDPDEAADFVGGQPAPAPEIVPSLRALLKEGTAVLRPA